jgi:hypothetical protein
LILISTNEKKLIPYHTKIISSIKKIYQNIHPDFETCNPILSGSYLLKLSVFPDANYSDYDLYFTSETDYQNAKCILDSVAEKKHENINCITYNHPAIPKQVQIIKTYTGSASHIISKHDLENAKIAYQNDKLYFTLNFLKAWANEKLIINSFQTEDFESHSDKFYSIVSTLLRIKKYADRYNLELCSDSISKLKAIKLYLIQNEPSLKEIQKPATKELSYLMRSNILTLKSLINAIDKFIHIPDTFVPCPNALEDMINENSLLEF